jgi:putative transposase
MGVRSKYEEVYLHEYQTVADVRTHLAVYFWFYNEERLHEMFGYRTPHEVSFGMSAARMPVWEAAV